MEYPYNYIGNWKLLQTDKIRFDVVLSSVLLILLQSHETSATSRWIHQPQEVSRISVGESKIFKWQFFSDLSVNQISLQMSLLTFHAAEEHLLLNAMVSRSTEPVVLPGTTGSNYQDRVTFHYETDSLTMIFKNVAVEDTGELSLHIDLQDTFSDTVFINVIDDGHPYSEVGGCVPSGTNNFLTLRINDTFYPKSCDLWNLSLSSHLSNTSEAFTCTKHDSKGVNCSDSRLAWSHPKSLRINVTQDTADIYKVTIQCEQLVTSYITGLCVYETPEKPSIEHRHKGDHIVLFCHAKSKSKPMRLLQMRGISMTYTWQIGNDTATDFIVDKNGHSGTLALRHTSESTRVEVTCTAQENDSSLSSSVNVTIDLKKSFSHAHEKSCPLSSITYNMSRGISGQWTPDYCDKWTLFLVKLCEGCTESIACTKTRTKTIRCDRDDVYWQTGELLHIDKLNDNMTGTYDVIVECDYLKLFLPKLTICINGWWKIVLGVIGALLLVSIPAAVGAVRYYKFRVKTKVKICERIPENIENSPVEAGPYFNVRESKMDGPPFPNPELPPRDATYNQAFEDTRVEGKTTDPNRQEIQSNDDTPTGILTGSINEPIPDTNPIVGLNTNTPTTDNSSVIDVTHDRLPCDQAEASVSYINVRHLAPIPFDIRSSYMSVPGCCDNPRPETADAIESQYMQVIDGSAQEVGVDRTDKTSNLL